MSEQLRNSETRPNDVTISPANIEDAETICHIRDNAWLKAYPNEQLGITKEDVLLMAQGPIGVYAPRRIHFYKEFIASKNPKHTVFVAKNNEGVVGFVSPEIEESGRRRVGQLFVDPSAQGTGIGSMLLQKALEWHGLDNEVYLEVVSYNANAISFYETFGFKN
jgi:GNAT superfamily N-acetyltransferase